LRNCPLCNARGRWTIGEVVAMNVTVNPLQPGYPGMPVAPFVTVYCQNCGNTHFVNLFTLGFTHEQLAELHFPFPSG
jgi:hypothetical protein